MSSNEKEQKMSLPVSLKVVEDTSKKPSLYRYQIYMLFADGRKEFLCRYLLKEIAEEIVRRYDDFDKDCDLCQQGYMKEQAEDKVEIAGQQAEIEKLKRAVMIICLCQNW